MKNKNLALAKMLYLRFSSIYGSKFVTNLHNDNDFQKIWFSDWAVGIAGLSDESIKQAIQHCMLNLAWPPSIAEFRGFCEKHDGLPAFEEAYQKLIRQELDSEIVQIMDKSITSWDRKNKSEDWVRSKAKQHYEEAVATLRRKNAKAAELELIEGGVLPEKKLVKVG